MTWVILIWFGGLALSAFFSGSETGFYRVTHVRVVIDAMQGDRAARGLLWLINRPTIYVANCLIGNNIANYMTSLAVVVAVSRSGREGGGAELIATLAVAPVLFVYGELLPKYLFYNAPNRLLRWTSPLFLISAVIFLPLTVVVWAFNRVLELVLGHSPQRVQMALARRELKDVFEEGHEVGILQQSQRELAQSLLTIAGQPVTNFSLPLEKVASVPRSAKRKEALRVARRRRAATLLIEDAARDGSLAGYVRVIDLYLSNSERIEQISPLSEIAHTETHIAALVRMETDGATVARIVGPHGETCGIVTTNRLIDPLLKDG